MGKDSTSDSRLLSKILKDGVKLRLFLKCWISLKILKISIGTFKTKSRSLKLLIWS